MGETMAVFNPGLPVERLAVLDAMFVADRTVPRAIPERRLAEQTAGLVDAIEQVSTPLVYTAFDGDLFELTPQMRSWVFRQGWVPANPENIVGYKDSVDTHKNKAGVLVDDLAILRRCDRLCVFTDVAPDPAEAMSQLAEGVIVELLFFLAYNEGRGRPAVIEFVPTSNLFGRSAAARPYRWGHAATIQHLASDQAGIRRLLDTINPQDPKLPPVAYFVLDPLDAKYVHWLRPYGYGLGVVPLVPTLALRLADLQVLHDMSTATGLLSAARCRLLALADELWILPPQHAKRPTSFSSRLVTELWSRTERTPLARDWRDVQIPKTLDANWALTAHEAAVELAYV